MSVEGGSNAEMLASQKLYGGFDIWRSFWPGLPNGWSKYEGFNGSAINVSFKADPKDVLAGRHDAALTAWFSSAPVDKQIYWTYFHEPEDDIERGSMSAADYRAAWNHVMGLADSTGKRNLHATLVLMAWSTKAVSKRNVADYFPSDNDASCHAAPSTCRSRIEVMAWDGYSPSLGAPNEVFDGAVAATKSRSKSFAVAETGYDQDKGATPERYAAWLPTLADYLQQHDAVYVTYFNTNNGGRYVMTDKVVQDAWRSILRR
jgi:hypothetical protein